MNDIFAHFLLPLSIGGIGGFVFGYATKKIMKILVVLLGFYIISLYYLMNLGAIEINSQRLLEIISNFIAQIADFLANTITYFPLSGGFAIGFILGTVKG